MQRNELPYSRGGMDSCLERPGCAHLYSIPRHSRDIQQGARSTRARAIRTQMKTFYYESLSASSPSIQHPSHEHQPRRLIPACKGPDARGALLHYMRLRCPLCVPNRLQLAGLVSLNSGERKVQKRATRSIRVWAVWGEKLFFRLLDAFCSLAIDNSPNSHWQKQSPDALELASYNVLEFRSHTTALILGERGRQLVRLEPGPLVGILVHIFVFLERRAELRNTDRLNSGVERL
ncbi:hypothetical protein DFH06DRAFT_1136909 [Mycena polygramma]|nr:hypothetical protein DFH06DRAFT_1136909 [Mycena polygramma]